ncbi:MAG: DUF222 domain-containing protein [Nocardioidaceae bacterium]
MFDMVRVDAMAPGPQLAQELLTVDPTDLDHEQLLVWLRCWQRFEAYGESRRVEMLGHYADIHPPEQPDRPGRLWAERAQQPGGDGTPQVAEFAVDELAVAAGWSHGRAFGQLGDALDLRHRMPRLFARLAAGEVAPVKVRQVLRAAHGLSQLAARRLDEAIAPIAEKVGPRRLEQEIDKVLIAVDPAEADRRTDAATGRRQVAVSKDEHGNCQILADVDALDGMAFDAAVDHVADLLRDLGDTRAKDIRRAAAIGWLANPAATMALARRHRAWQTGDQPLPWPTSVDCRTDTDPDGHQQLVPGIWRLDLPEPADLIDHTLWPTATIVMHLDPHTWQTQTGPVDLTGHGPITAEQAFDRLRHHHVTIKPVIDLDNIHFTGTLGTDFTGTLREAVLLANPWNPFPYADAQSKDSDDLDHTLPRNLGGPTTLDNGAPLRRRLHRTKTFANGWRVKQPEPGIYIWRTPEGRLYLCDRRGLTHDLGKSAAG